MKKLFAIVGLSLLAVAMMGIILQAGKIANYRCAQKIDALNREWEANAIRRANGRYMRTADGTTRFQWITRKHSSQRDQFPDDDFFATDEPGKAVP